MAIFKVINSGNTKLTLYLSTISKISTWRAQHIINNGSILTWNVSGGYTANVVQNIPTINLSTNTGTATMAISNVNELIEFNVPSLSVTSIDSSQAVNLIQLVVSTNLLNNLDVTNNINLERLSCFTNLLTTLDVSTNILLNLLYISANNISTLDISNNPLMSDLRCYGNNQASSVTNQIFIDLDTHGLSNGELHIRNNADGLGLVARTNLITKGWIIVDSYTT